MRTLRASLKLPFVAAKCSLTWREVAFGLVNELAHVSLPIDMAVSRAEQLDDAASGPLLALATARADEPVTQFVLELAAAEPAIAEEHISDKWLYLVMAFVFEQRRTFDDPLAVAEDLYSDFNYPEQIRGCVRYMPWDERSLGNGETYQSHMLQTWQEYLWECEGRYKPS